MVRNTLGRSVSHSVYLALGQTGPARQAAYRALFGVDLDQAAVSEIRLALIHGQPLGNERFRAEIEKVTGIACEVNPPGRPRQKQSSAVTG